jgi:hypothetical protein
MYHPTHTLLQFDFREFPSRAFLQIIYFVRHYFIFIRSLSTSFFPPLFFIVLASPTDAVAALEQLHAINPQWPQLGPQLVNAHTYARRLAEYRRGGGAPTSRSITSSAAAPATTARAERGSSSSHSSSHSSSSGKSSSDSTTTNTGVLPPTPPPPLWSAWWVVGCGAPAVQGLARVGDIARTFDRVQGFWEPGDLGVVVRNEMNIYEISHSFFPCLRCYSISVAPSNWRNCFFPPF